MKVCCTKCDCFVEAAKDGLCENCGADISEEIKKTQRREAIQNSPELSLAEANQMILDAQKEELMTAATMKISEKIAAFTEPIRSNGLVKRVLRIKNIFGE